MCAKVSHVVGGDKVEGGARQVGTVLDLRHVFLNLTRVDHGITRTEEVHLRVGQDGSVHQLVQARERFRVPIQPQKHGPEELHNRCDDWMLVSVDLHPEEEEEEEEGRERERERNRRVRESASMEKERHSSSVHLSGTLECKVHTFGKRAPMKPRAKTEPSKLHGALSMIVP